MFVCRSVGLSVCLSKKHCPNFFSLTMILCLNDNISGSGKNRRTIHPVLSSGTIRLDYFAWNPFQQELQEVQKFPIKIFWIIGARNFEMMNRTELSNKIIWYLIWISTFLVELHLNDVPEVLLVIGFRYFLVFSIMRKSISTLLILVSFMKFCVARTFLIGLHSPRWCSRCSPGGWINLFYKLVDKYRKKIHWQN